MNVLKKIMLTAMAVGAVTAGAPVAHAVGVTADCGFNTVAQASVTGGQDTFTGVAYGYAVSDQPGASISVRCEVRVNGGTADATDPGPSGQSSATGGQVTFTAGDTDNVQLCAVWTGSESGEACSETSTTQVPPQELIDLIANSTAVLDPIICLAFKTAGVPAVVNAAAPVLGMDTDDCDLYVNGGRFIDFVPYDD